MYRLLLGYLLSKVQHRPLKPLSTDPETQDVAYVLRTINTYVESVYELTK